MKDNLLRIAIVFLLTVTFQLLLRKASFAAEQEPSGGWYVIVDAQRGNYPQLIHMLEQLNATTPQALKSLGVADGRALHARQILLTPDELVVTGITDPTAAAPVIFLGRAVIKLPAAEQKTILAYGLALALEKAYPPLNSLGRDDQESMDRIALALLNDDKSAVINLLSEQQRTVSARTQSVSPTPKAAPPATDVQKAAAHVMSTMMTSGNMAGAQAFRTALMAHDTAALENLAKQYDASGDKQISGEIRLVEAVSAQQPAPTSPTSTPGVSAAATDIDASSRQVVGGLNMPPGGIPADLIGDAAYRIDAIKKQP